MAKGNDPQPTAELAVDADDEQAFDEGSAEARAGKTTSLDELRVLLNADDLQSLDEAVTAARRGKLIPWAALQRTLHQPFDHRTAFAATTSDLRISLVREFLHDSGSALSQEPDPERIYAAMQLPRHQNGLTLPRNIGLLFFSDDPQQWFPAARIQLTEFADPIGEHPFKKGPSRARFSINCAAAWRGSRA